MRRVSRLFAEWKDLALVFVLLFLAVLTMSGCFEPEAIVAVPPTATVVVPEPTVGPTMAPEPRPEAVAFPLAAPVHVDLERPTDRSCVECHLQEAALKDSIDAGQSTGGSVSVEGAMMGEPPAVEAWQQVYLDRDDFFDTIHGRYGCIGCHGGRGDAKLKESAHQGMNATPSRTGVCEICHTEEIITDENSLHANMTAYRTVLFTRSSPEKTAQIEGMMEEHCVGCHSLTCGQCHVSRPDWMGGGLIAGHMFTNGQALSRNCAVCHRDRIEKEYKGVNENVPGDVHWVEGKFLCSDCHLSGGFHGTQEGTTHRYDGQPIPSCQSRDCHPEVAEDDGIEQHGDSHLELLSCQACHSTTYTNCYGCHVGVQDGMAYYEVEPPTMAFKIGRNPLQGRYRPWQYVPVRHVPVTRDSFVYYGEDLLPNFDKLATWKYTTPHNIQRITPQTEDCNTCHGNADVFLTVDDVAPNELQANRRVIVREVPTPVD